MYGALARKFKFVKEGNFKSFESLERLIYDRTAVDGAEHLFLTDKETYAEVRCLSNSDVLFISPEDIIERMNDFPGQTIYMYHSHVHVCPDLGYPLNRLNPPSEADFIHHTTYFQLIEGKKPVTMVVEKYGVWEYSTNDVESWMLPFANLLNEIIEKNKNLPIDKQAEILLDFYSRETLNVTFRKHNWQI